MAQSGNGNPPYYVKALAMALPAMMLGWQISGWIFFLPSALQGRADFRQLYTAGYMVRTGHGSQLYDYATQKQFQDSLASPMYQQTGGSLQAVALPFIRPAYQALLFVPLSLLSYRTAYFVFLFVNCFALAACFVLLRGRLTALAAAWNLLPIAMFLCFIPTGVALMQGQDSILLLLAFAAALVNLEHGSEFLAGLIAGMALFKFQIAIPVAALFMCWRRWRFVAGFCLTAAVLSFISIWIIGLSQIRTFLDVVLSIHTGFASDPNQIQRLAPVTKMMNLHGMIYGVTQGRLGARATTLLSIGLSAMFFLYAVSLGWRRKREDQFKLAILCAVIVSYYIFIHDLVILLIPLSLILNETLASLEPRPWIGAIVACVFLAPSQISYAYLLMIPLVLLPVLWLENRQATTAAEYLPGTIVP